MTQLDMPQSAPSPADETFRLRTSLKVFFAFFYLFAVVVVVGMVTGMVKDGEPPGFLVFVAVWTVGLLVQARWVLFRMPWTIELTQETVEFVSRSGFRRSIAYASLRSVGPLPLDFNNQFARWVSDNGAFWSSTTFDGWNRLLRRVEERAPQAEVE